MRVEQDWVILFNAASKRGKTVAREIRALLDANPTTGQRTVRWVSLGELPDCVGTPERIITIGGDGTINAAVSWLFEHDLDVPLALLPAGTGNNLARGLQLPLDVGDAFAVIESSTTRPLDAIVLRGDDTPPFAMVQSAALGFPAETAKKYDDLRRHWLFRALFKPLGPSIYRLLALSGLRTQKRRERRGQDLLDLELRLTGGETRRESVIAVFLGNERSLGGNFIPCPQALLDDGRLDICTIRAGGDTPYLQLFRRVLGGDHLRDPAVSYLQTAKPLELAFSRATPLLVDGDIKCSSRHYFVDVVPGRFRIVAPTSAEASPDPDDGGP